MRVTLVCWSKSICGAVWYDVRCNGPESCTYANIVEIYVRTYQKQYPTYANTHTTHTFTFQFHWGLDSRSYQGHDGSLHFSSRLCIYYMHTSVCLYSLETWNILRKKQMKLQKRGIVLTAITSFFTSFLWAKIIVVINHTIHSMYVV